MDYQTRYTAYLYRQLELAYQLALLDARLHQLRERYDELLIARLYGL